MLLPWEFIMTNNNKARKITYALALILTLSLIFSFGVSALGLEDMYNDPKLVEENILEINGEELAAFAAQYDNVKTLTGEEALAHDEKVNDILFGENLSSEQKRIYLTKLGVFEINPDETVEYAASSSGDVTLNKPTIRYDSATKQYIITATGKWNKHSYEVPTWSWWVPSVGSTKDIGGPDAIGISLTNTSGSTSGLALKSGYGCFHNGTATETSSTLATENDNYGGGYKVQDFIKFTEVINCFLWYDATYLYNAYNMTCVLRYNNNFKNYNGSAKLFYSHTWDNTSVTSVNLSKTGAAMAWSKTSNYWNAYSYARTFKNGAATN